MEISKIRYALFDFDDTLCIHKSHYEDEHAQRCWYSNVLKKSEDLYPTCITSPHMKTFMDVLYENSIKLGLISAVSFVATSELKIAWVEKHYGHYLQNHCVGSTDAKVDMLIAIADTYGLQRSEILIVDDHPHVGELAAKAGFVVMTPLQVVDFV